MDCIGAPGPASPAYSFSAAERAITFRCPVKLALFLLVMSTGCASIEWMPVGNYADRPRNECRPTLLGFKKSPLLGQHVLTWKLGDKLDPAACGLPSVAVIQKLQTDLTAAQEAAKVAEAEAGRLKRELESRAAPERKLPP